VEAFAQVRSDAPLYLLLVGGGELENAVREQVAALGLQGRVRFLGVRADVADILRASDVFVLSSRVEGNPLSGDGGDGGGVACGQHGGWRRA
jgi:glycosyltransferase involved in cell wall biosynthesis